MSKTSPKPIERIEQILQGLLNHLKKNSDEETFRISLQEFSSWGSLLSDRDGLEIAFAKIGAETNTVSFKFEWLEQARLMTASEGIVSSGKEVIKIHVEDAEGVQKYLAGLAGTISTQNSSVETMSLVKPENSLSMYVVVNGDYLHPLEVSGNYWDKFYLMVEKGGLSSVGNKGFRDYFNSNKECQLYSKTGFGLTKLIGAKGGMLVPLVPVEIITEIAYKRRLNSA